MSESQSRYSIVERLTHEKLEIIDVKAELVYDLVEAEEKVAILEKILNDWEGDIIEDVVRTRRIKNREIEQAKKALENAKSQKDEKQKTCDEKLKAIEEALVRLEKISELAE